MEILVSSFQTLSLTGSIGLYNFARDAIHFTRRISKVLAKKKKKTLIQQQDSQELFWCVLSAFSKKNENQYLNREERGSWCNKAGEIRKSIQEDLNIVRLFKQWELCRNPSVNHRNNKCWAHWNIISISKMPLSSRFPHRALLSPCQN